MLTLATGRVGRLVDCLRRSEREAGDDEPPGGRSRRDRVLLAAGHLAADLARVAALTEDEVAWVDGGARSPEPAGLPHRRRPAAGRAPVGHGHRHPHLGHRAHRTGRSGSGSPADECDELDVGSPFDYRDHAMLYVAQSLPDRRRPESEPALHDELEALINAAGGRTLALFTSWRAMNAARRRPGRPPPLPPAVPVRPAQAGPDRGLPADEATCLFATLGFWQGVDIPGRTLSLVTLDRIPFPRPDEPVLQARRERAGAGRLQRGRPAPGRHPAGPGRGPAHPHRPRTAGVVAVLDSRLATARYRGALLARVPPMKRTVDRAEVVAFLRRITADD